MKTKMIQVCLLLATQVPACVWAENITEPSGGISYLSPGTLLVGRAERIVYKTTPQGELCLYLRRPANASGSALPAIVYFSGGGWVNGTADGVIPYAEWFREQGIIGIAADYRVNSRHGTTPLECVKDAKSAIRFVRQHAKELGVDPNRIIAAGGSAGGHIAAATVLPGHDEPDEDVSIRARPDALVLHSPVLGLGFGREFFSAHPDCSPMLGVCPGWPPTIVSSGTADVTTPHQIAVDFVEKMKSAGNTCELITIPNGTHADWPVTNPNFLPTVTRMAEFLREQEIIPSAPAK